MSRRVVSIFRFRNGRQLERRLYADHMGAWNAMKLGLDEHQRAVSAKSPGVGLAEEAVDGRAGSAPDDEYLLEVDLAREVLQVWSDWRADATPSPDRATLAVIHYAENDAFEPPSYRAHTGVVAEHTLILLRHAKSDWSGHEGDHDRPLAKRGRRQAPDAGRWLAVNIDSVDLAVVSTAKRARTTWDLASNELDQPPRTRHDDAAYAASAGELLTIVRNLDEALGTVVLVGHNPGIEDLAETLTGDRVPMPTSALAVIELASTWDAAGRVRGRLRTAGRPPTSAG